MNDISPNLKLLLVEDNDADAGLLLEMLRDVPGSPAWCTHVRSMREAEAHLATSEVDVIVLDIGLPDVAGIGAVHRAHDAAPRIPVVVLTGLDDEALARQSLQQGAQDYLPKGEITPKILFRALRYAIERKLIEDELRIETERARRSTERLRLATEYSGVGVWDWNIAADQLTWDSWMARLYGFPAAERLVSYEQWLQKIHPEDRDATEAAAAAAIGGGAAFAEEFRVIWPDGSIQHIRALGQVTRNPTGRAVRMIGISWDVSESRRLAAQLAAEHEMLEVTLQSIGDAVVRTDHLGRVTFANATACQLLGTAPAADTGVETPGVETRGGPVGEIARMIEFVSRMPPEPGAAPNGARKLAENYDLIAHDGTLIPIEGCIAPIRGRGGEESGQVIVFRDVSAQRAIAQQLSHRANHDLLTGLPNRLLLGDRIDQAITVAPRHGKKVGVLFMDLDGFKHVNDTLGHLAGDQLLKSVARRLVACVRGSDTVCRQGGDEFVVLLSEIGEAADAALSARRILHTIGEKHVIDGQELHISASTGVSVYPDDGADAETLLKAADTAMYQAKANGRGRYQFFEPGMKLRAVERQSIEQSFRRAIETPEFELHYQPKINLQTGLITGVEALIRWTHPERGAMEPASFIPIAEDCGAIRELGAWVLREACAQARSWTDAGLPALKIAVNISPLEFGNGDFFEDCQKILDETGFDPAHLELEITEGVLMKRAPATLEMLHRLKASGITLAIDDFGTGYSSLSYLTKFPVDTIKIDQSFIRQIGAAPAESTIVKAVIGMARGLNINVVAEGVETAEERDFLSAHHCDEAQGFLFSRPLPASAVVELLQRQAARAGEGLMPAVAGHA